MRVQPKHAYEDAATRPTPSGVGEEANTESLGSAAHRARFDGMARKSKPSWLNARLLTLSFLSLALAVVLWGLEYKVSLYHPHPDHRARVGVAKLWVEPRRAVVAKSGVPAAPELHLLISRYVRASDWSDCARGWDAEPVLVVGSLSRQRTPRSPPAI
jgi:hypothetical protein